VVAGDGGCEAYTVIVWGVLLSREMRSSIARIGLSTGLACTRCWVVYGSFRRHSPEVGAVCGKAARMDLCGGRPEMDGPAATASPGALQCRPALGDIVGPDMAGKDK
jgi:hypothetical protein